MYLNSCRVMQLYALVAIEVVSTVSSFQVFLTGAIFEANTILMCYGHYNH